jgi:regulator of replication initiation timing
MSSFISTFITVGICLAIYAYIKKKYADKIALLEEQIANLNLDLVKYKTHVKDLDNRLFVKDREISNYKTRLDTMVDINKELNSSKTSSKVADVPNAPAELKKRGRKPGSKKPFYKKKSGGSPS